MVVVVDVVVVVEVVVDGGGVVVVEVVYRGGINVIESVFDTPKALAVITSVSGAGLFMKLCAMPVEPVVAYCGVNDGAFELSVKFTTAPVAGLPSSLTVADSVTIVFVYAFAPLLLPVSATVTAAVLAAVAWVCAVKVPANVCFTGDEHDNVDV